VRREQGEGGYLKEGDPPLQLICKGRKGIRDEGTGRKRKKCGLKKSEPCPGNRHAQKRREEERGKGHWSTGGRREKDKTVGKKERGGLNRVSGNNCIRKKKGCLLPWKAGKGKKERGKAWAKQKVTVRHARTGGSTINLFRRKFLRRISAAGKISARGKKKKKATEGGGEQEFKRGGKSVSIISAPKARIDRKDHSGEGRKSL